MVTQKKSVMALDLGTKNIGLAIFTPSMGSFPLSEFSFREKFEVEKKLSNYIEQYQVEVLVLGDMGLDKIAPSWQKLLGKLKIKYHLDITVIGEKLTSVQAEQDLSHPEIKLKDQNIHAQSALNILNDYLSSSLRA